MVELLANVSGGLGNYVFAARQTALWPEDAAAPYFERMLFRVGDGWLDTPAGSLETAPAGYMSFSEGYFDEVTLHCEGPVKALLGVTDVDQLLACLGDADEVRFELYGDPDGRFTTEMHVRTGETVVRFDRLPDEDYLAEVPERMPETFEDGRFHHPDGTPAPTVVETTTDALARIVDAVDAVDGSTYPLTLSGDGPVLDLVHRDVSARAQLSGRHVAGPTVRNRYGEAFAKAVRTMTGAVRLECFPHGPLAMITDGDAYTGRLVVPGR